MPHEPEARYVPERIVPDHVPVQVLTHVPPKVRTMFSVDPLSVPVRVLPNELWAPGAVCAKVPVTADPDCVRESCIDTLPRVLLTTVPTQVPVIDDGWFGLGPQPLPTAISRTPTRNGRMVARIVTSSAGTKEERDRKGGKGLTGEQHAALPP